MGSWGGGTGSGDGEAGGRRRAGSGLSDSANLKGGKVSFNGVQVSFSSSSNREDSSEISACRNTEK
jgi:hypothetical protein